MDRLTDGQVAELRRLSREEVMAWWNASEEVGRSTGKMNEVVRVLVLADLYYLLVRVCGRTDMLNDFAFERCREVEASPNGHLDLWAREHFKSSIITFGLTIQDILKDPETTIGIFSHTRPIAKAFLRQIMQEFEKNKVLHAAFPDVLWGEDTRAAPKWSEDEGIVVRRKTNPKEATIEAWGVVDSQPTSKHFAKLIYDDVVVAGSVSSPEMIAKTMTELERSYNLGTTPGIKRGVGTRWHYQDAYRTMIDRGTLKAREHPGRLGGTEDGESVFWSEDIHFEKRRDMGMFTYAAQILLNPAADSAQGFRRDWLRHYKNAPLARRLNTYICVDAASSKKKGSDYTAMMVVGLGVDGNYYVLDMVRDRLNLAERMERLFELHRKYKPRQVRHERYGMLSDIEAIRAKQEQENYRFEVVEVAGVTSKIDRIRRLIPIFEQGRMWLPTSLHKPDWQKQTVDLVDAFVNQEYLGFPHNLHDDMLDSLARICEPDLKLAWPKEQAPEYVPPPVEYESHSDAWLAV